MCRSRVRIPSLAPLQLVYIAMDIESQNNTEDKDFKDAQLYKYIDEQDLQVKKETKL